MDKWHMAGGFCKGISIFRLVFFDMQRENAGEKNCLRSGKNKLKGLEFERISIHFESFLKLDLIRQGYLFWMLI